MQRLEQAVLDLMTTIDNLNIDIYDLKKSNEELSGKLRVLSDKIDEL